MKKQLQAGLIIEGNSTRSAVLRLPNIAEALGPIKSRALRVARRVSNVLRAGYPVAEYEGLQAAQLILIRIPDPEVPRIVEELCRSELIFKKFSFVLCESWLPADVLNPLRARGASVATLLNVPGTGSKWFVVEGQVPAVRQARRFIEANESRALEIRPGTKKNYCAAMLLATAVPVPLFLAAQRALRSSGISGHHLHTLLNAMAQSMFRDLSKGGRAAWGDSFARCAADITSLYFDALRLNHPHVADLLREELSHARLQVSKAKGSSA